MYTIQVCTLLRHTYLCTHTNTNTYLRVWDGWVNTKCTSAHAASSSEKKDSTKSRD